MTLDQSHTAREYAERLTKPQRAALLLLHISEPVRQTGSGVAGGTWKSLRNKGMAKAGPSELVWWLTPFGAECQRVVRELEGLGPLD